MKELIFFLFFYSALHAQESKTSSGTTENDQESGVLPIHTIVEEMPEYPGGTEALKKYLGDNIKYPKKARRKGITGKCLVKFIIEPDGSIGPVEIVKGIENCPECNNEAARAVREMPVWKPGKVNGKEVRVYFTIPIGFVIKD